MFSVYAHSLHVFSVVETDCFVTKVPQCLSLCAHWGFTVVYMLHQFDWLLLVELVYVFAATFVIF